MTPPAVAAPLDPVWATHGVAWVGAQGDEPDPGGGLGATVALRAEDRIDGELLAEVIGSRDADATAHLFADAALRLVAAPSSAPTPWVVAGLGVLLADEPLPALQAGGRLEIPLGSGYLLRVDGRVIWSPDMGPLGASLTVGPGRARAAAPAAIETPVEPPGTWPDAAIWIEHPRCGVYPSAQTPDLIDRYGADLHAELRAEGYERVQTTLGQVQAVELKPLPAQGSLVVVAHPGDEILVGGLPIPLDEDGVAVLNVATGAVEVVGTGGGQRVRLYAAVARQQATWVRLPAPADVTIPFAVGSAEINAQSRYDLLRIASEAGGWSFVVQGYASPDGDARTNLALAAQRAEAVARALRKAGVPADRVRVPPSDLGDPAHMANWGRVVIVRPLAAGEPP